MDKTAAEDGNGNSLSFLLLLGRLCNSYVEGRFSIFRCGTGNAVLDGSNIVYLWRTMVAREMCGATRIAIDRADYRGSREHVEKRNQEREEKE